MWWNVQRCSPPSRWPRQRTHTPARPEIRISRVESPLCSNGSRAIRTPIGLQRWTRCENKWTRSLSPVLVTAQHSTFDVRVPVQCTARAAGDDPSFPWCSSSLQLRLLHCPSGGVAKAALPFFPPPIIINSAQTARPVFTLLSAASEQLCSRCGLRTCATRRAASRGIRVRFINARIPSTNTHGHRHKH